MKMKADRNFRQLLERQWAEEKFVCVGLDPDLGKIPKVFGKRWSRRWQIVEQFILEIVDSTQYLALAFKPQIAFYESLGPTGFTALERIVSYIRVINPNVPIILDAKRGDIGSTNDGYVKMAFERFRVDAITVNPYLGSEALAPFLRQKDKGIIVLCRTSNPGAGEFQDLMVDGEPLYQRVARQVVVWDNQYHNCSVVVGATYPKELAQVRQIVGDMPILLPGIGAQGGEVESTVRAGMDSRGLGMIINSSRGVLYKSSGPDFAESARDEVLRLNAEINRARTLGPEQPRLLEV